MAEVARILLQCGPEPVEPLGAAFGLALPTRMLTAQSSLARAALRLGPDEWLLLAGDAPAAVILPVLEAARGAAPASLVDVSDRQIGLDVDGPTALALLAEGCPLDLDSFPLDGCTRTLFGKVEVVLWRRAADWWRIEVARSLAPHLEAHFAAVAADLG